MDGAGQLLPAQPRPEQPFVTRAADRAETVELLRARIAADLARSGTHAPGTQPGPGRKQSGDTVQDGAAGAARAVCLRLLTGSARTQADLEGALTRRGFEPEVIDAVLSRLGEVGLIDDRAYAEAFVRGRHQSRALARPVLDRELRQRGVDPDIAAEAVAQLDDGAEAARAAEFVRKRLDRALVAGPETARRRLLGQLARRGYPGDVAYRVVDAALAETQIQVSLAD